ncbi:MULTISPECIES: hypothetical protein [Bacillus]|uniref:hypothetical protein n=1 Tax=Bacillus TaxID=1386 RepID=UPI000BB91093|nr:MULTISPECIES: hypothetical protein [Bacillus]
MDIKAKFIVGVLTVVFGYVFFNVQQFILTLLPINPYPYVGIIMTILLFFGFLFCYIIAKQIVDYLKLKQIFLFKR